MISYDNVCDTAPSQNSRNVWNHDKRNDNFLQEKFKKKATQTEVKDD
jgi:hypothetical protein